MAKYINQSGDTGGGDLTLLQKHVNRIIVKSITITCTHASNNLVIDRLYLDNGTNEFDILHDVKVPLGATLLLDEGFNYDFKNFDLKIETSGSSSCSIIII